MKNAKIVKLFSKNDIKTYIFLLVRNFQKLFLSKAAKIRDDGLEASFASNSKNNASNLLRLSNKRYSVKQARLSNKQGSSFFHNFIILASTKENAYNH